MLQILLAVSVFYVWGLNFSTMTAEWPTYGLPDWVRVATGLSKLTASVLLVLGALVPVYAFVGAVIMGALMTVAVGLHLRARDPLSDTLPSLLLTILSAGIVVLRWPAGGLATLGA